MQILKKYKILYVVNLIILTAPFLPANAGDSLHLPKKDFISFPREYKQWQFDATAGFSLAYIPKVIVEEEIFYSPLLDLNMRLGCPYNFSIHGRVSSIGITNQFIIGAIWSLSSGPFSFSLNYDFAYWLGTIKIKGFNVLANGLINYPGLSVGYDFKKFFVSIKGELLWVTFHETFTGETKAGGIKRDLAGFALTYNLEQPLWKSHYIAMGFKLNCTKFFYQSWMSFSTFDRFLIFPEFHIGLFL